MQIKLENIGRRFNRDWIFRNINYEFFQAQSYAILGANGAGKSTLLKILSGSLSPTEGNVRYLQSGTAFDPEKFYSKISIAAPYLEFIEEFTLSEQIQFHFSFKNYRSGFDKQNLLDLLGLSNSKNKALKYFSSGMKQRVKLALAIAADSPVLLLDEPSSNLDNQGFEWYLNLVREHTADRLLIICSNLEREYEFCGEKLVVQDYK